MYQAREVLVREPDSRRGVCAAVAVVDGEDTPAPRLTIIVIITITITISYRDSRQQRQGATARRERYKGHV